MLGWFSNSSSSSSSSLPESLSSSPSSHSNLGTLPPLPEDGSSPQPTTIPMQKTNSNPFKIKDIVRPKPLLSTRSSRASIRAESGSEQSAVNPAAPSSVIVTVTTNTGSTRDVAGVSSANVTPLHQEPHCTSDFMVSSTAVESAHFPLPTPPSTAGMNRMPSKDTIEKVSIAPNVIMMDRTASGSVVGGQAPRSPKPLPAIPTNQSPAQPPPPLQPQQQQQPMGPPPMQSFAPSPSPPPSHGNSIFSLTRKLSKKVNGVSSQANKGGAVPMMTAAPSAQDSASNRNHGGLTDTSMANTATSLGPDSNFTNGIMIGGGNPMSGARKDRRGARESGMPSGGLSAAELSALATGRAMSASVEYQQHQLYMSTSPSGYQLQPPPPTTAAQNVRMSIDGFKSFFGFGAGGKNNANNGGNNNGNGMNSGYPVAGSPANMHLPPGPNGIGGSPGTYNMVGGGSPGNGSIMSMNGMSPFPTMSHMSSSSGGTTTNGTITSSHTTFSAIEETDYEEGYIFGAPLELAVSRAGKRGVPDVVISCVEYLNGVGLGVEGLYRIPGSMRRLKEWIERFEVAAKSSRAGGDGDERGEKEKAAAVIGLPVDTVGPKVTMDGKVKGGLVPEGFWNELDGLLTQHGATESSVPLVRQFLDTRLPTMSHLNTMSYFFHHLHKVQLNSGVNLMTPKNLVIVIFPNGKLGAEFLIQLAPLVFDVVDVGTSGSGASGTTSATTSGTTSATTSGNVESGAIQSVNEEVTVVA
ncbi:hypothetical protein HDU76_004117 [Blyttiomyces sp. JEL0837]|nr:hypothetical protein HDU76_004117 [Blyttiomyces sp. JEL0837]